ncbi:MAG: tetratricopeptide repeat protein, partial [Phycisphaerales bacterium]
RFGLPARIYQAKLRRADAAEEWGVRIAAACERARGVLSISDPLWVALVNDMIRWETARGASAPELAAWFDTIVAASDAAYGELSDFSLAMLCERAAALGKAGDFDEGMKTIEEYVRRRETALATLSDEQYMRHERIVEIFDKHDSTDVYWQFMRIFNEDAKRLSEQSTSNYFIYSGQIYGMWLWTYGHYEECEQVLSELLQVMRSPLANQITNARLVYRIGVCRVMLGRPEHALELLREAENMLSTRYISWYQGCYLAQTRGWIGQCLSDLGRYDEAEGPLLAAHDWLLERSFEAPLVAEAKERLITLYERWGDQVKSEEWRRRLAEDVIPPPEGPQNLGFEGGLEGETPPGWVVPKALADAGATALITHDRPAEGASCVRVSGAPPGKTVNALSQEFSAIPYRKKRVRVSASVRTETPGEEDRAYLTFFFEPNEFDGYSYVENSVDRPIRWPEWDRFEIECDVKSDSARMLIRLTVYGNATAWLDDVRIEVIDPENSAE